MTTITATDDITVLTIDQRAGFLRELAEHVENERRWAQKPFTEALPGIVQTVASACCPEPLVAFDELVDAVEEVRKFTADEASYADEHDWSANPVALLRLRDRLESNVDCALQKLLGGAQ